MDSDRRNDVIVGLLGVIALGALKLTALLLILGSLRCSPHADVSATPHVTAPHVAVVQSQISSLERTVDAIEPGLPVPVTFRIHAPTGTRLVVTMPPYPEQQCTAANNICPVTFMVAPDLAASQLFVFQVWRIDQTNTRIFHQATYPLPVQVGQVMTQPVKRRSVRH